VKDSGTVTSVRFATDKATAEYYDRRAGEYDDWYLGKGLFVDRDRPDGMPRSTRLCKQSDRFPPRAPST
jgi:hypothetical protein